MSNAYSYVKAEQRIQHEYQHLLEAGKVIPASSVVGSLNFIVLIAWLLVCGSLSDVTFKRGRAPVFIAIVSISFWNLLYVRSIGVVGSIGVGLNSALCIILAANFVLIHEARLFKRLTLRPPGGVHVANRHADLNGTAKPDGGEHSKHVLVWQSMPPTFGSRLAWVFDLITSFRHVHWSWNITRPSSPISEQQWLASVDQPKSKSLIRNCTRFLIDYLFIDLVKSIMIADPYFTGHVTTTSPPHLARYITSPWVLYSYRTVLAASGVWVAIDLIFSFVVLLHVNLLGSDMLGLNAFPAAFPPLWGSLKAVSQKGLRGFWGETWHQVFRMHFVSIGDAIARILLPQVDRPPKNYIRDGKADYLSGHPLARLIIRLATAFFLSGVVHACASYTLLGPTAPWKPLVFFTIQPLGMAFQSLLSRFFTQFAIFDLSVHPKPFVRQVFNCFFTIGWLWTCSGMFLDDVTSGGIWMFEPIPVSLVRGFGFSSADKRFWCW